MVEKICSQCGKVFEQNESNWVTAQAYIVGRDDEKQLCCDCALNKITGNSPPEEADLNSARLIFGEMTDGEWQWMRECFLATEEGRSPREYVFEHNEDEDYDDPDWCYDCKCYHDYGFPNECPFTQEE